MIICIFMPFEKFKDCLRAWLPKMWRADTRG